MSGISPASTLISNLPQAQATHYDKDFIENLKANTPFIRCTERRELPAQSGNQHRLYMYQTFGANIQQQAEGTVGSGITPSVNTSSAIIGQYADYCNVSDIALETAIDPALENLEREVAYRLALSLSTLVRNTADGSSSIDATVNSLSAANASTFLSNTVITAAGQHLLGRNVKPFDQGTGDFCGIIHPFPVGDVVNDPTNNSLVDIYKRTTEGLDKLNELPSGEDNVPVLDFRGFKFYQSSIVTQTANYKSSTSTAYRTYVFGHQGVITISLGVKENAQMGEGDWHNMKIWMMKADTPTLPDPSRVIGGWVSYNVKFVPTLPPDTTMRLAYFDFCSQIS